MTAQPSPRAPVNTAAVVGIVAGIITALAVILRPFWLITDVFGVAAIVLGFVGLSIANRTGTGRRIAAWAVALGFTPLLPLVLVLATRLDYY